MKDPLLINASSPKTSLHALIIAHYALYWFSKHHVYDLALMGPVQSYTHNPSSDVNKRFVCCCFDCSKYLLTMSLLSQWKLASQTHIKRIRALRGKFGPLWSQKLKVAFHQFNPIGLLEEWPKCKILAFILLFPLLW